MIGMFATSKAGHDKNQLYIIINETGEYVYLVDGVLKTMDKPKKKSKKHIQIIKYMIDSEIAEKLKNKMPIQNEEIKRAIKMKASK
ncbi:MAG: KOW domain-containing RNA-binding protein [Lachnospiraceae bacterium]|nr:KOW domain-containing RNA-binding protein [Lachnospiraceae bacterium]